MYEVTKMNKHEVKYNNISTRINNAFIDLLETKKFSDISISEICSKANIHRSTFYAHYNNTIELATDLERSLMIDFYKNSKSLTNALKNRDKISLKIDILTFNAVLSEILEYIKKYKRLFALYDEGLFFKKAEYTNTISELLVIPAFKASGINDETTINYLVYFYMTGMNAIISKWVKDNCKLPVEEVCEIAQKCFNINFIL